MAECPAEPASQPESTIESAAPQPDVEAPVQAETVPAVESQPEAAPETPAQPEPDQPTPASEEPAKPSETHEQEKSESNVDTASQPAEATTTPQPAEIPAEEPKAEEPVAEVKTTESEQTKSEEPKSEETKSTEEAPTETKADLVADLKKTAKVDNMTVPNGDDVPITNGHNGETNTNGDSLVGEVVSL